jgi:CO dehydrogenase maturation factor
MGLAIAITGKGGSGKTTIAAITVGHLVRRGLVPVLAVDADPNACLDETLGVKARATIGSAREELRDEAVKADPAAKRDILQMKAARALVESDGFDLIAMGRPEGPGCYCYANNLLRDIIQEISAGYPYIVIDNEAGLENLSRRIVQSVDCLVIAADSSRRGLETVRRIRDLALEMGIRYRRLAVAVNRIRGGNPDLSVLPEADFIVRLPEDDGIFRAGEESIPLPDLPAGNPVVQALGAFIDELFKGDTA